MLKSSAVPPSSLYVPALTAPGNLYRGDPTTSFGPVEANAAPNIAPDWGVPLISWPAWNHWRVYALNVHASMAPLARAVAVASGAPAHSAAPTALLGPDTASADWVTATAAPTSPCDCTLVGTMSVRSQSAEARVEIEAITPADTPWSTTPWTGILDCMWRRLD